MFFMHFKKQKFINKYHILIFMKLNNINKKEILVIYKYDEGEIFRSLSKEYVNGHILS